LRATKFRINWSCLSTLLICRWNNSSFNRKHFSFVGKVPADIAFIIRDKQHPLFQREGSDIVYTAKMKLSDALCGCSVQVPTLLEGKSVSVSCQNEVVKPKTVKRLQGYGLPYPKEPSKRGDLVVKFDIQFPDRVSQSSKDILRDVLA